MFKIDNTQAASFFVACEEGSIRATAERLGAEPSTISRQLKALEASLNIVLVERGRKGVRPTEAGRALYNYLKQQQSDQETLLSEFDALTGMRRGEIIIAIGDGFINDFIANAIKSYMEAFPGLTYDLLIGSTEQVLHAVRTDQAHIGLAYNSGPEKSIRILAQVKQPLQVLISPLSKWADIKEPISISSLEKLPYALLKSGFGIDDLIRDVEYAHGIRFHSTMKSNSLTVLRHFVREGLGATIFPAFVVTREISDGTIITKSIDIPEFSNAEASIFTRTGRRLPEAATRLAECAIRTMAAFNSQV